MIRTEHEEPRPIHFTWPFNEKLAYCGKFLTKKDRAEPADISRCNDAGYCIGCTRSYEDWYDTMPEDLTMEEDDEE